MTATHVLRTSVVIGVMALACRSGSTEGDGDEMAPPGGSTQQLTVREIPEATTSTSGLTQATRVVIRDAAAWDAFWGSMVAGRTPRPATPSVDFGQSMVIAAAMGQRPSGGYLIKIDSVSVSQSAVSVVVRSVSPGPNCMTTQIITAPVVAVTVPRADGQVTFIERVETKDCS
jgi:hypothetical protein